MDEYKTKYGAIIPKHVLLAYFKRLTARIFKFLPELEEGSATLSIYIESLLIEISGGNNLIFEHELFLELLANLEPLIGMMDDFPKYRKQVLKCTGICNKILNEIEFGGDADGV